MDDVVSLEASPGARLRQARERAGLGVVEVAAELNVRPQLVEALEGDEVGAFPAQVYARGLLRNYARLLGLDPEPLLLLHAEIVGDSAPPLDSVRKVDHRRDGHGAGRGLMAVVIVFVLSSGYALYRFGAETSPEAVPARNRPAAAATDRPPAVSSPAIRNRREDGATTGDVATQARHSADETTAAGDASAADSPPPAEDGLLLVFDADSWVEIRDARGRRLLSRTGRAGQQMRLKGMAPFDVRLGYAPGVRMEYNGRPYEVPEAGRTGVAHFQVGTKP